MVNSFFENLKNLNRISHLPQNSVVFAEFPRSGGTFISSMLLDLVFDVLSDQSKAKSQLSNYINQTNLFQFLTDYDQLNVSTFCAKKHPCLNFFKTHKCLTSYTTAYIIIVRHPLKIFKSYYGYSFKEKNLKSAHKNINNFFHKTSFLKEYVKFNAFYLHNQKNQKTFFIKNEDITLPPYRLINDLRQSFGKDISSESYLESKLKFYAYSRWANNEEYWNNTFAFNARRNITHDFEWDPDLVLSILKKTSHYDEIKNIASTYGYCLQDKLT